MSDFNDFNRQIIEEFRANQGKVGGQFEGAPLLLLHSRGARTGAERINPLVYQEDGARLAVFASKAGAPTNPDWYHNLMANPQTSVEVGAETVKVTARTVEGQERERIWARQKETFPNFAEYEVNTTRRIPVVVLERSPASS